MCEDTPTGSPGGQPFSVYLCVLGQGWDLVHSKFLINTQVSDDAHFLMCPYSCLVLLDLQGGVRAGLGCDSDIREKQKAGEGRRCHRLREALGFILWCGHIWNSQKWCWH